MNKENLTKEIVSTRGGARQGAGRPKGTLGAYKEKVKKQITFRLSEEEEIAVRKLLKKMRNR